MKKLIFALLICVSAFTANAQIGYNYDQYELGANASFNSARTDFVKPSTTYSFGGHFTYNYSPYINFFAEVSVGSIKADSIFTIPSSKFSFNNDFTSVAFRAQLQAGEFLDYSNSKLANGLKNLYISGGIGVLYTDLQVYDTGVLSAQAKGSNLYIPIKAGYEFKFFNSYSEPVAKLDIGYQLSYVLSDNFDGYTSGNWHDAFTQLVIGVRFGIGGKTSYRKQINW